MASNIRSWYLATALCFLAITNFGVNANKTTYQIGMLNLLNREKEPVSICMVYPDGYYSLATEPIKPYNLSYEYEKPIDLCKQGWTVEDFKPKKNDSLLLLSVSTNINCTISKYYEMIQKGKASGIILLSNYTASLNQSYGWDVFAVVRNDDITKFLNSIQPQPDVQVEVTKLVLARFDPSLIILWLMAVVCVGLGSWTGPYRSVRVSCSGDQDTEALGGRVEPKDGDEANVYGGITIPVAIGLVVFISATLLLLYFFYQYLVYFFIGIFCLASSRAMYLLVIQLINYLAPGLRFPKVWRLGIHEIVVGSIAISLAVVWFIYRHTGWVWIIQDLLGACFCIHLIQTLQLPNMKIITSILVMLFIYDVFFVFITPYFTSNGNSVMVEVATGVSGSGSRERLPMLLQFPRLLSSPADVCGGGRESSLLGFGDIIVPGFLVCFAHAFDLQCRKDGGNRPYFISSLIAYSVGLGGAFIALILSSSGQPALFYIVPCILFGIFSLGLIKGEVKALWRGGPVIQPLEHGSS